MICIDSFSASVISTIQYYVYLYIDPRNDKIFYVGKGKGNRCFSHLNNMDKEKVYKVISELKKQKLTPKIDILVHGLPDEETALHVEAAVINIIGLDNLTNIVQGHTFGRGRTSVEKIQALYDPEEVEIVEPSILIRIAQLYRNDMTPVELYDATRGIWRVGEKSIEQVDYAFAIHEGVVLEVYIIENWYPAGSTFSTRWIGDNRIVEENDRFEFVGRIAPESVRKKYVNKSVKKYLSANNQNPIRYVNIAQ